MIADYGFFRIGIGVPAVRPAAVTDNLAEMLKLAREAAVASCDAVLFPELSLTGASCGDLFLQSQLRSAVEMALVTFLAESINYNSVFCLGLPVFWRGCLYNCAALVCHGKLLGLVPKTNLRNSCGLCESRWFTDGENLDEEVHFAGQNCRLSPQLLVQAPNLEQAILGVKVGEIDAPGDSDCRQTCLAGANVLLNCAASGEYLGRFQELRENLLARSRAWRCAIAYCSAGPGESSTDSVYAGHRFLVENGTPLVCSNGLAHSQTFQISDIDVDCLDQQRLRDGWRSAARSDFHLVCPPRVPATEDTRLLRRVEQSPFLPGTLAERRKRCAEALSLQVASLTTRLRHTGLRQVILGLSGGLDSALALIVCQEAFAQNKWPLSGIHVLTMPGFGTGGRTSGNAALLCQSLGLSLETVSIVDSCRLHLKEIGHDGKTGDATYENSQARERTQILMDKANLCGGLVVGTGDLSELALGWCTYGGDHLSMYAVNGGVPKTAVREIVRWYADQHQDNKQLHDSLTDILETPVSPELLPADANGDIAQKTEELVGPYELHDFFLYHFLVNHFTVSKILYLAIEAFGKQYRIADIKAWLKRFCSRFFSQQFKRSCLPDGPAIWPLSLSPRCGWQMPSDASADEWLKEN